MCWGATLPRVLAKRPPERQHRSCMEMEAAMSTVAEEWIATMPGSKATRAVISQRGSSVTSPTAHRCTHVSRPYYGEIAKLDLKSGPGRLPQPVSSVVSSVVKNQSCHERYRFPSHQEHRRPTRVTRDAGRTQYSHSHGAGIKASMGTSFTTEVRACDWSDATVTLHAGTSNPWGGVRWQPNGWLRVSEVTGVRTFKASCCG